MQLRSKFIIYSSRRLHFPLRSNVLLMRRKGFNRHYENIFPQSSPSADTGDLPGRTRPPARRHPRPGPLTSPPPETGPSHCIRKAPQNALRSPRAAPRLGRGLAEAACSRKEHHLPPSLPRCPTTFALRSGSLDLRPFSSRPAKLARTQKVAIQPLTVQPPCCTA